jgi:hypothetical protein
LLVDGRLEKRQGAMRPAEECRVFIRDHHAGYIDWATYEENRRMTRRNSVNWEGDEAMAAIRAGQGLSGRAPPLRTLRTQAACTVLGRSRHQCTLSLQGGL